MKIPREPRLPDRAKTQPDRTTSAAPAHRVGGSAPVSQTDGGIYDRLIRQLTDLWRTLADSFNLLRDQFDWLPVSVKHYGARGDGTTDDTKAIQNAAASGRPFYFPTGTYLLNNATFALDGQTVSGMQGAVIIPAGGVAMNVTASNNSVITGLTFRGTGDADNKTGLQIAKMDRTDVVNCTFETIESGIVALAKVRENWAQGNNFVPATIRDCVFNGCGTGLALMDDAEYITVSGNVAFGCTVVGIYCEAGNSPLIGNQLIACEIGIHMRGNGNGGGTLTNPDHTVLSSNVCNHCNSCGIFLDGISIALSLIANQIWAVNSTGNLAGYGRSYGLFLRNSRRVACKGNAYNNMNWGIGFDGMAECSFDDQIDNTASPLFTYMRCEGNGVFAENRNISIKIAPTNSGTITDVVANYSAGVNTLFRVTSNLLANGISLTSAYSSDYVLGGLHEEVVADETFTHNIIVPNFRKSTPLYLNIQDSLTTGVAVVFGAGATFRTATTNATVAGTTVTLRGSQIRYTFTPTATPNSWIITAEGTNTAAGTYQPLDATLTALSGNNWALNAIPVGTGADTVAQMAFAANTFPARSSAGNLAAKPITDFGLSLVDDANAAAALATLGLPAVVAAGTYTPTFTAVANVSTSTPSVMQWLRVGNTVTVSGRVDVQATAVALTQIGISLPVASALTATQQCAGTGSMLFNPYVAGVVTGDAVNDRAQWAYYAPTTANTAGLIHFTYQVL